MRRRVSIPVWLLICALLVSSISSIVVTQIIEPGPSGFEFALFEYQKEKDVLPYEAHLVIAYKNYTGKFRIVGVQVTVHNFGNETHTYSITVSVENHDPKRAIGTVTGLVIDPHGTDTTFVPLSDSPDIEPLELEPIRVTVTVETVF